MNQREPIIGAILAVAGCALLAYGLWLAWPPLGYVTAGLLLIATDPADVAAGRGGGWWRRSSGS